MEVTNYDLVMITTFISKDNILKLLDSLLFNQQLKLFIILVVQDTSFPHEDVKKYEQLNIKFLFGNKFLGISKARNLGINYLSQNPFINAQYIMFPDDDTTFDAVFFEKFHQSIEPGKNFVIPIFNEGSFVHYKRFDIQNKKILGTNDFKYVGTPNMILKYNIVKNEIRFDEQLGPGGAFGSSEDIDFYFKCSTLAPFIFLNDIYNFHPAKQEKYNQMTYEEIIIRFRNYSAGYIFVMLKYKKYLMLPRLFTRTLGAAIINFFNGNWKLCRAYFAQFFIRIKLLSEIGRSHKFN